MINIGLSASRYQKREATFEFVLHNKLVKRSQLANKFGCVLGMVMKTKQIGIS